ncbi:MAG: hypothetical protein WHS88_11720 [Anaerohalosphaeraceae bacterium]
MVNLEDLAIAAEYWLTAVFDDERLGGRNRRQFGTGYFRLF